MAEEQLAFDDSRYVGIFQSVVQNDVGGVEECLRQGISWSDAKMISREHLNIFAELCPVVVPYLENVANPLHIAALLNHIDVAAVLCRHKSDDLLLCQDSVRAFDLKHRSALFIAVQEGHVDMCAMLLSNGAIIERPYAPVEELHPVVYAAKYRRDILGVFKRNTYDEGVIARITSESCCEVATSKDETVEFDERFEVERFIQIVEIAPLRSGHHNLAMLYDLADRVIGSESYNARLRTMSDKELKKHTRQVRYLAHPSTAVSCDEFRYLDVNSFIYLFYRYAKFTEYHKCMKIHCFKGNFHCGPLIFDLFRKPYHVRCLFFSYFNFLLVNRLYANTKWDSLGIMKNIVGSETARIRQEIHDTLHKLDSFVMLNHVTRVKAFENFLNFAYTELEPKVTRDERGRYEYDIYYFKTNVIVNLLFSSNHNNMREIQKLTGTILL